MGHNAKVLLIGTLLAIAGICVLRFSPLLLRSVRVAFVGIWAAILLVNLWCGIARAGYSIREELGVALLDLVVIALPTLLIMRSLAHS